jgi:thermosome
MTEAIPAVTESGQPVLILKEGTQRSRGRDAQRANIMASKIIAEVVKSSLGPKGMDKMLVDSFGDVTITNDGATILGEMEVQHPAAKMMVEIAKTQDKEVGDGTTTVVVFAGQLLEKSEDLIDKDVHPTKIIEGYNKAAEKALEILDKIAIKVEPTDKKTLKKIAATAMASKLVSEERDFLSDLAVDAILQVAKKVGNEYKVDIDDVKVEKKAGESLTDTTLIKGILLDKEVVHPGMPKRVENAKIAILECPLEIEKTEFDAKINIENPEQMKAFLDEESNMLKEMVDKIVAVNANVVICQKGIDDLAQYYLAQKGILAVRRVKSSDMEKLAKATGGRIITNLQDLAATDLGSAKTVEERKVGEDKMTFVEGCKNAKAVTILIRGGTERIVDEAERSIHDALFVVKDVVENPKIVAGGGASEAEVAKRLRDYAAKLSGREQLAVINFAEALEAIPMILAENAGMDPIDTIVELRSKHDKGGVWVGVDVLGGKVKDMSAEDIYEPLVVKTQTIKSANEVASMILRVDDMIASSKMKEGGGPPKAPGKEEGGED